MARIDARSRLMLALDVPTASEGERLLERVGPQVHIVKIGLELFVAEGPAFVRQVLAAGKKVFLDLKFLDIEETVKRTTAQAANLGVQFLTVHAQRKALQAAVAGRGKAGSLKILGVTVLTNYDVQDIQECGSTWSVEDLVMARARLASTVGCDGVIASGKEAGMIRKAMGSNLLIVTPGIRPLHVGEDDHARATTPKQAIETGADYLVVGRPIRDATDPVAAVEAILEEMQAAFDAQTEIQA